jgi:thioredoxin 1
MSDVIVVDDSNFDTEVLQSLVPVLVDFGAVWCGPCQKQMLVLAPFATQHKGRLKVVKVDVDDAPGLTAKYSIKAVPAMFLFFQGKHVDTKVGLTNATALDAWIKEKTGR